MKKRNQLKLTRPETTSDSAVYLYEILSGWDTLDSMRAEIQALEAEAAWANIFFDSAWIQAWHQHLSSGKGHNQLGGETLFITVFNGRDQLVAFWPFFRVPGIKKPGLWPVACQSGDFYEPVVRTLDPEIFNTLGVALKEVLKTHSFVWLPLVRQESFRQYLAQAFRTNRLWTCQRTRSENAWIEIPPRQHAESYFDSCMGAKTRQTLARKKRRLAERGNLHIEVYESYQDVKKALPLIAKIEDANWKGQSGIGLFSKSDIKRFYFDALPSLAERGKARISLFWCGEKPIAYEMGLIDGKRYLMHNLAYLPDYGDYSPGILLLMENIAWCFDNGFTAFDFLQGSADYKTRFANSTQPLLDVTLLPSTGTGFTHWMLLKFFRKAKKQ